MISVRSHTVMGRTTVSVWCASHGDPHCLWSGSAWRDSDDPVEVLSSLSDGVHEASVRASQGLLDDLTDECGL
jgi:hypothetical protein